MGDIDKDIVFSSVEDAITAVRNGGMVIVMDDKNRENEGDLIMAAQYASQEKIAFILKYTTGIICAAMTKDRAQKLKLPPMVEHNTDSKGVCTTLFDRVYGVVEPASNCS